MGSPPLSNGNEEKEKGVKEGDNPSPSPSSSPKSVPFLKLFSFADPLDILLMFLGTFGGVGNGASMPILMILFGQTIDAYGQNSIQTQNALSDVSKVVLRFVYVGIGAGVASYMQVTFWMITGERQSARIRSLYLKAILRQDIAFFDSGSSTGEVIGRMSGDIIVIQEAMGEKVGLFLQLTTTFLGGFIVAFVTGWKLTLVMLGAIPLLVIAGALMAFVFGKMTNKGQEAYAQAGDIVEQTIGSIRTVLSFTGEKKAVQDYSLALTKAYKASIQQGLASGLGTGFALMVMFGTYALSLWYGSKLIVNEGYTGGNVMIIIFSVLTGGMSLGQASPALNAFAAGKAAASKMFEVINRVPDIDVYNEKGICLGTVKGDIEFRNVGFAYPTRPDVHIFSNFSLMIPSGTTAALVGESGSGKSTVISLIERFYDPQQGMVLLDGIDLKQLQLQSLRQHIGLVSQEPVLFGTSIFENIAYGKDGSTREEIEAAANLANAAKFINQMPKGYNTMVGEHGTHLSGGQKQRVAIARAILKNPQILLLDEATSALDAESEHVVQEALDKVMVGRTTIIVAHRLSTIRNADFIAVVHRGEIVETGTHNDLIQKADGAYHQLIKLQQIQDVREGGESESDEESRISDRHLEQKKRGIEEGSARVSSTRLSSHSMRRSGRSLSFNKSESIKSSNKAQYPEKKHGLLDWMAKKKEEDIESSERRPHVNVSLTRLAALNKPEIPIFLVGSVAAMANGLVFPIFSLLISKILSTFFNPSPQELRDGADFWSLMFLVLAIGSFIVISLQLFCFAVGGSKLVRRVRILMFEKVLHQEISWFDETANSSGAISARLSADAAQVKSMVGDALALAMQNLSTIVASLVIAFTGSWQLALVILAVVPLLGLQSIAQIKVLQGFSADAKVMYEEASQVANDAVSSIRTVASFCAEDKVLSLYEKKCSIPLKSGVRKGFLSGTSMGVANLVMFCTYALCFWYGSKLMMNGDISMEDFFRVFFAVIIGAVGLAQSAALAPDIASLKTAVNSVFSILDRKSQIDPSDESGTTITSVSGNIEFRKVNFKYPTRPDIQIFNNFCLAIPAGKTVALVGESGSGKSTAISLLQRFYDPDSGVVLLDGIDTKRLKLRWLRQQMGLVSQEPTLFNDSIRANIAYGKDGIPVSEEEIIAAAEASNAHSFISALPEGYMTRVGERGIQLSGGQKQRIAIARAMLKNPKVLLLDEATSALDAESEHVVQEALERVMMGKSSIVIAHRLSTIKNVDIIAVLKNGEIVEKGKHDELMAIPSGIYASLVQLHMSSNTASPQ